MVIGHKERAAFSSRLSSALQDIASICDDIITGELDHTVEPVQDIHQEVENLYADCAAFLEALKRYQIERSVLIVEYDEECRRERDQYDEHRTYRAEAL